MTKEEIMAALDEAGIEYDGRLGAEKLAALLPSGAGSSEPEPAPAAKTVKCRVLRDYWPDEYQENRVRKGDIIEATLEQALDGVEAGNLERVKD